jgi:hypothetical protein
MRDEHYRTVDSRAMEQHVEVVRDRARRARHRPRLAEAVARAVVTAGARRAADELLHFGPFEAEPPEAALEDDRRLAVAGAVQMQMTSADRDHAAGRCRE